MEMNLKIVEQPTKEFKAVNPNGASQTIDGDAKKGLRPMESLLNAYASCAALDLVHILKKQKQDHKSLQILVAGLRPDEGHPKPFTEINMHFILTGALDQSKVERAVQLSVEKYCSVGESLHPSIKVNYKTSINP